MEWSDRLGRRINLRDLRVLMAVADTGSMAKAAARLRISHPAVSKTISELEGALGARLLDRRPRWAGLKPGDPPSLRASDIVLALTAAVILLVLAIGICMQVRNWMMAG